MAKKSKPPDDVRLFGLSGVALQTELEGFEVEYGLKLRLSGQRPSDADNIYYPQFEQQVRDEAAAMAQHYEIFYCLEKSIRKLIDERLSEAFTTNWWGQRAPPEIVKTVEERMQRDVDSAVTLRSVRPLDFTTFGELGEIIKHNWETFGDTFNSRKAVEKVMANLNVIRGPIAHCSLLAPDEVVRLQLSLRDWFRLMG